MKPHFALFRFAMARPAADARSGHGSAALLAALIIGAAMIAAIAIPMLSG